MVREIQEEIGITLDPDQVTHFCTRHLDYGTEHTFIALLDVQIDKVVLTEGQRLDWFSESQAATTKLAYEDNTVLAQFFASHVGINT